MEEAILVVNPIIKVSIFFRGGVLKMAEILMCPPSYFSVSYEINPWMSDNIGKVDKDLADAQWYNLRTIIEACCVKVVEVDPVDGLPDMVFTANAGLLLPGGRSITSQFNKKERQPETQYFKTWFENYGFYDIEIPVSFEGAGDALYDSLGCLWVGSGFRSDRTATNFIKELYPNTIGLTMVNPSFYHLDTCFCPLSNGYLLYYPHAFDETSKQIINDYFGEKAIAVEDEDAKNFACNAVNIENTIIMNKASDGLKTSLLSRDFTVVETPTSEYIRAGGSTKCLTLKL